MQGWVKILSFDIWMDHVNVCKIFLLASLGLEQKQDGFYVILCSKQFSSRRAHVLCHLFASWRLQSQKKISLFKQNVKFSSSILQPCHNLCGTEGFMLSLPYQNKTNKQIKFARVELQKHVALEYTTNTSPLSFNDCRA